MTERTVGHEAPVPQIQAPAAAAPAAPAPVVKPTFEVLPLSRELRQSLAEMGYTNPTPVQIAVWEPATRGKDAVVQARTGTGKTTAFGLPIVDHVVRRSQQAAQVLVLTPTRELALQVAAEIERLGKHRAVKISAIYGGAPMPRQVAELADGAQVIVGTPGRVLDHLRRGTLDARHIRMLVLDEADEMLSMGFEREMTAILESLPKDRQTLLFSATLPPDIQRMAKKLRTPEFVTLSGDHVGALEIEHYVYMVASDKIGSLVRIIEVENPESAVVFCNTKDETERVAGALQRRGYDADWLNGDLPQGDREKVMSATRAGKLRFLVATDVAARGIDISHLTHVINHDFPQDAEAYVHRTGRTGRAGRTGTAISLITPRDVGGLYLLRLTYRIRPIERQVPSDGELKTRTEADLVTMLAEAFGAGEVHPDDLALARRLLTHERAEVILAGLLRDHLGARPTAKQDAAAARRATTAPRPAATKPVARPPVPPPPPVAPPVERKVVAATPVAAPVKPLEAPVAPKEPVAVPAVAAPLPPPAPAPATPPAPPAPTAFRAEEVPKPVKIAPVGSGASGASAVSAPEIAPPAVSSSPAFPAPAAPVVPVASVASLASSAATSAAPTGDRDRRDEPRRRRESEPSDPGSPRRREDSDRGRPRAVRSSGSTSPDADRRGPRPFRDGPREAPVSHDSALTKGVARPAGQGPQRHADFTTWQPPEEEGDDEPILAGGPGEAGPTRTAPGGFNAPSVPHGEGPSAPRPRSHEAPADDADGDFVEIYVNIGRRDGARASDYQQILTEKAGLDRSEVRRIRVRERNAFVSVRREDLGRALAALSGATLAGKSAVAEQARERGGEGGAREGEEGAIDAPTLIPPGPGLSFATVEDPGASASSGEPRATSADPDGSERGDRPGGGVIPS